MREKVKRLIYGAFFEKDWQVASVRGPIASVAQASEAINDRRSWQVFERPNGYRFLADPFPLPEGGVAVEAFRRSDGQGEIVELENGSARRLCGAIGHFSYPATVELGGDCFIVPEVAEWSRPMIYRLRDSGCEFAGALEVDGGPQLLDATFHVAADAIYLFANVASEGGAVLRLWTAPSLFSRFTEHPANPIHISPVGGRMAGSILRLGPSLYRLGQDNSGAYGKRIVVFEILELSPSRYAETHAGELSLSFANGPHTFNIRGSMAFFDFYHDRFTPFAGYRRLRAAWSKRKALAAGGRGRTAAHANQHPGSHRV
jgi:hypothetical protein